MADNSLPLPAMVIVEHLISSFFMKTTTASRETAIYFLHARQWDLSAAVSAFNDFRAAVAAISTINNPGDQQLQGTVADRTRNPNLWINTCRASRNNLDSEQAADKQSESPAVNGQSARRNSGGTARASDVAPREKSGTFVGDPKKDDEEVEESESESDVESPEPSSSPNRVVSDEPQSVWMLYLYQWRNAYTLHAGPFPVHANFIEDVQRMMISPRYLNPQDKQIRIRAKIIRRQQEMYNPQESRKLIIPFQGVGRTLSGPDSASTEPPASTSTRSVNLVVDHEAPTTSIQLRLADGTRIISRFNTNQTVRDIRDFIDSVTQGGSKNYQLLIMDSPPKPLPDDCDQTIEDLGISKSVLIQKF